MKKNSNMRWDTIVGVVTLFTILCFAVIIYIDYSKGKTVDLKSKLEGNTIGLSLHDVDNQPAGSQNGTVQSGQSGADNGNQATASSDVIKVTGSPVVVIDPAHGGSDSGTANGTAIEKNQTLEIANAVKKYLEQSGVKVILTRTEDSNVGNAQRTSKCNSSNADAVVSIHRNSSSGDASANGAEAWIHTKQTQNSKSLAASVLSELNNRTGIKNRGVKTGTSENSKENYYINAHCVSPSCVLQLGFITNKDDNRYVTTQLEITAKAVADGIVKYLKTKGY